MKCTRIARLKINDRRHLCDAPRKSGSGRASKRLFAPRDYNGYGKAGSNPAEWAYEWSPFSVIIGALSTLQCRARNWHAKIGCDPIVGHCPIQAAAAHCTPASFLLAAASFRIFRRRFSRCHIADRFTRTGRRKKFSNDSRMPAHSRTQETRLLSG